MSIPLWGRLGLPLNTRRRPKRPLTCPSIGQENYNGKLSVSVQKRKAALISADSALIRFISSGLGVHLTFVLNCNMLRRILFPCDFK